MICARYLFVYVCIVDRHKECGGHAAGAQVGRLLRHAPRDVRLRGQSVRQRELYSDRCI